jgi:hypothetical protein
VRQWVLSLPLPVRYLVAYDSALGTAVLGVFTRAVRAWYRKQAKTTHGVRETETAAVTVIQRFGGGLNLNPHFHSNWADGVWDGSGPSPRFTLWASLPIVHARERRREGRSPLGTAVAECHREIEVHLSELGTVVDAEDRDAETIAMSIDARLRAQ